MRWEAKGYEMIRRRIIATIPFIIPGLFLLVAPLRAQQPGIAERDDGLRTISSLPVFEVERPVWNGDSTTPGRGVENGRVNGWRLALVCGAAASTLGASYIYLRNSWWKDDQIAFHFDGGPDLKYAVNLDKAAHFYGGLIAADLFYGALRWSNLSETAAIWTGVGLGAFVQIAIEMKDGYSPTWGFSVYDVGSGIAGSLFHAGQRSIPFMRNFDVKFSYAQHSDRYFHYLKTDGNGTWNDDYVNQTYWLSCKVNNFLPKRIEPYWPDWLALAVGVGVDETLTGYDPSPSYPSGKGNIELYLALDYDVTKILPFNSQVWEAVKHYLNYFKFPAPALRVTPYAIWYGLYF
jgi:hypothetical protein